MGADITNFFWDREPVRLLHIEIVDGQTVADLGGEAVALGFVDLLQRVCEHIADTLRAATTCMPMSWICRASSFGC